MNKDNRSTPSNRRLAILCAASAFVYCAAAAPASIIPALVLGNGADLSAERATGTIWRGEFESVRALGVGLGDVAFQTRPLALLAGRLAADFSIRDGAVSGKGRVGVELGGKVLVTNAALAFRLDAATRYAFLGAPLDGYARAKIERFVASRKGCVDSRVEIWTDVLSAPAKRFETEAFDLVGEGVCSGRDFLVSLSGRGGEGGVTLSIRVSPELTYTLIAEAQPARTEVAEALRFFGFEETAGALTIGAAGVIQSVGS